MTVIKWETRPAKDGELFLRRCDGAELFLGKAHYDHDKPDDVATIYEIKVPDEHDMAALTTYKQGFEPADVLPPMIFAIPLHHKPKVKKWRWRTRCQPQFETVTEYTEKEMKVWDVDRVPGSEVECDE